MSKTKSKATDNLAEIKAKLEKILGREVSEQEVAGAMKAQENMRVKEAEVVAKYGKGSGYCNRQTGELEERDLVAGSYSYRENDSGKGGKWGMEIRCLDTGDIRWVATSDLHQVARSIDAQKDFLAKLRKGKRSKAKKLDPKVLEALKG